MVEEDELLLQISIWANIFLNYKHKMWLEYILKLVHNQMGAMNVWTSQVNKVNVILNMHVCDIEVKLSCW